jgi:hypothetical protein
MSARQAAEKNAMYGRLPSNALSILYNGKTYSSVAQAARENNMTRWKLLKSLENQHV